MNFCIPFWKRKTNNKVIAINTIISPKNNRISLPPCSGCVQKRRKTLTIRAVSGIINNKDFNISTGFFIKPCL